MGHSNLLNAKSKIKIETWDAAHLMNRRYRVVPE
jgi:hypothetical protein